MGYVLRAGAFLSVTLLSACAPRCSSAPQAAGPQPGRDAAPAPASGPTAAALAESDIAALPVLLFFGDSLTAGYQLAADEAFPARIESRLRAEKIPFRAVNAGISGDTTAGGLARLDWSLKLKPAAVFLCLGANDGLRGLPLEDTERNLRELIQRIQKAGAQAILGGMLIPSNYGADYTAGFKAIYPRLAKEFSLPLVPFLLEGVALQKEMTLQDGVHPNPKGTQLMADTAWPVIAPVLARLAGKHP